MGIFTGETYDETVDGDLPFADPYGPIFGKNTTIKGTTSASDFDVGFVDLVGIGNFESEHPRVVSPGPLAFTLTLAAVDDFQFTVSRNTGEVIYQKAVTDAGGGPLTINDTIIVPADAQFSLSMMFTAFGSSLAATGYTLTLGSVAPKTHFDLGTLGAGQTINRSDAIPAGADEVTYDFRVTDPLTLYNLRLTGGDVEGILEADAANTSPTLGPGPDRHLRADRGFGANPQIVEDPLMPGLYHYTVTRNGVGSALAPFTLVSDPLKADEAGNNRDWAKSVPVVLSTGSNNSRTDGTLTSIDNKDVFKFTLAEKSSVLVSLAVEGVPITLDGAPPIHYEIARADGSLVLDSHTDAVSNLVDTSFTTPLIDVSNTTPPEPGDYYNSDPNNIPLDPGVYFITIYKSTIKSTPDNYSLWVNAWPDGAANRPVVLDLGAEGPDSAVIGDLTAKTYTHRDFVGLADRNDFYVFYVTERSLVTFRLTNGSIEVPININLGGLPYHAGVTPANPLTLPTPDPVVSDIGPTNDIRDTGGSRSFTALLDPGIYNFRAYTETSFANPSGTIGYKGNLVYPKEGGAFYDLEIKAQAATGLSTATPNNDRIFGSNSADTLTGGNGDDLMRGGGGVDLLAGGFGSDTADFSDKTQGIVLFLDPVADVAATIAGAVEDILNSIENATGGAGGDVLVGFSGMNVLRGGGGNDYLFSNGFDPDGRMKAGAGDDVLDGGDGDDGLFGGDGKDRLDGGAGNDGIVGGAGNDILNGGAGGDFLFGGEFGAGGFLPNSGADTLNGGDGDDGLWGFDGEDVINGDAGNDYVEGGAGNDTINGGAGNDFLLGQDDNDVINGGTGFDYMYGGAGADTFVFRRGDSADWILDFNAAQGDRLKLQGFSFTTFAAAPLVDLSSPGSPAVGLTVLDGTTGNYDVLTIFGVGLSQLNATNVIFA